MLIHPSDPQLYLVGPSDLQPPSLPPRVQEHLPAFSTLLTWTEEFICQPHPQLGREGAVCPYVSTAREKGLLWLTAYSAWRPGIEDVSAMSIRYRDWFLTLEPLRGADARYKTILMLFPTLPENEAPAIIDQTQILLKPEFVSRGLMIGQFQARSNEPGAWNPEFHPLRSPVPLLVMRPMAPHDILFLSKEERYVSAYLKAYGRHVPRKLQGMAREAARRYGLAYPATGQEDRDDPPGEQRVWERLERSGLR